jgi:5'-nucleotidase
MAYPIDQRLVIAIASSALFDLTECDRVFREQELEAYRAYQRAHENEVLPRGVAFPLIRRILALNDPEKGQYPVEVVLLSRNDPDTGLRVFKSIEHYKLDISRAAFVNGGDPFRYLGAFNTCLFLSANPADVSSALEKNVAAGTVLPTQFLDDGTDSELRIAFDFDGVLADDSAEAVFKQQQLPGFFRSERENAQTPLPVGPLHRFFVEIAKLQKLGREAASKGGVTAARIRMAIVTARNAPAHERVVTSLRNWGIQVDEVFFLGGIEKARVLESFRPHIFFDDQLVHVEGAAPAVPCAHVPFGIANRARVEPGMAPASPKRPPVRVPPDTNREEPISA